MKIVKRKEFKTVAVETTYFVARDGKEFESEQECSDYEDKLSAYEEYFKAAKENGMSLEEAVLGLWIVRRATSLLREILSKKEENQVCLKENRN